MAANSLTKEQLKNELISHGVQPPVQSARKEEFIKLYEQHVAPIVSQKGDFSSDEETEVVVSNNSLVFDGLDVTLLSDEELYTQLQSHGVSVGPIVESTRTVYQRKLVTLLRNGAPRQDEQTTNGNGVSGDAANEKYSDSEGEQEAVEVLQQELEQEPVPIAPAASEPVVISTPEPLTGLRKRGAVERPPSSLSALPLVDRQGTPTPRPSIHSITSSGSYKYESRRLLDTTDGSTVQPLGSGRSSSTSPTLKIFRYILLVVIALVFAYLAYTYVRCDQVKLLVEGAKQKMMKYLEKAEEVAEKVDHAKPNPTPDV